jgi:phage/plasmid-associated DNA primase
MSSTITKTLKVKLNARKITDLCDDFSIPYVYCRIGKHYKTGKKVIEGVPKGVMELTYDQAMEFNKTVLPTFATHINCILKNGEDADKLMVIDFDDKDDVPLFIDTFGNDWKTKSSSRGLPHLWRLKKENDFSKDITAIKIGDKTTKIDLRYSNIFERIDSKIEYIGNMTDIPYFDFEKFHPSPIGEKPVARTPKEPSQIYTTIMKDYVIQRIISHLKNMNEDYISNDSDWFLIGNAIKSVFSCLGDDTWFEVLEQWSQLSKRHTSDDSHKWRNRFEAEPRCGLSTILNYSEKSNQENYTIIEAEYYKIKNNEAEAELNIIKIEGKEKLMKTMLEHDKKQSQIKVSSNGTDTGLAKTYISLKKDTIIKVDNVIYIYEGRLWSKDEDMLKVQLDMRDTLLSHYRSSLHEVVELKKKTSPEDPYYVAMVNKIIWIEEIIMDIQKQPKQKNILQQVLLEIKETDIALDKIKPYYFVFDNTSFDLETGKEVEIKKEDYITQSTHYNYAKPSQDKIDEMKKIINEILPIEDYRNCYLSILKSCLTGVRIAKFILATGSGRNGKGVISQLMALLLGKDYFYRGNALTLTKDLQTGSNVEIANMNNARMIVFSEPEENSAINLGVIKALTGEDSINARTIYSKKTTTELSSTIILEVNGKPNINGKINDSAIERWININFPSVFTDNDTLVDNITKFKQNTLYTELKWRQDIRCALFHILLEVESNKIIIPQSIREDTMAYLCNNDQLLKWFEDTYDFVEDGTCEPLSMQCMFQSLKESDFYLNLSKKSKREEYTKNGMIDKIKQNIKLKTYFFERKKINTVDYKNIITHYRIKEPELMDC